MGTGAAELRAGLRVEIGADSYTWDLLPLCTQAALVGNIRTPFINEGNMPSAHKISRAVFDGVDPAATVEEIKHSGSVSKDQIYG